MKTKFFRIVNEISNLENLIDQIDAFLVECYLSAKAIFNIKLCIDELVSNSINYGYPNKSSGEIEIYLTIDNDIAKIIVIDNAIEYNPLKSADPNLDTLLDERQIGGLGVFLVKQLTIQQSYSRINDKNVFEFTIQLVD